MLIFCILLIIMGVVLFATPGINSLALSYLLLILMLVYGIGEIIFYVTHHKLHVVSGRVLPTAFSPPAPWAASWAPS